MLCIFDISGTVPSYGTAYVPTACRLAPIAYCLFRTALVYLHGVREDYPFSAEYALAELQTLQSTIEGQMYFVPNSKYLVPSAWYQVQSIHQNHNISDVRVRKKSKTQQLTTLISTILINIHCYKLHN